MGGNRDENRDRTHLLSKQANHSFGSIVGWERRAAMSLSRLWTCQGKRDEARELLAPICGWFTEGFDTADLQEAKILLEELTG